ncbi:TIGR02117 family protein [Bosea caraganae]|uniref:TIGR02117 family protein n=1 Tax=Bosea caraganae TaxID=2763117 RepID=A0A370L0C1_9HYPH|nr:TIGR02117 family protein [Bosea caraganae]RDJ20665.1 TIGR02117 family protein [Bosea caraganae]RDJ28942.1 TIGR02117 family protein [Bosea caraganae]
MLKAVGSSRAIRLLRRGLRAGALGLAVLLAATGLALLAGAVPLRSGPAAASDGTVTIYVMTNGFHTDVVVPTQTDAKDWRPLLQASPITRPSLDAPLIAFGWGSQAAYTELGTLADLSPALMLKAVAFDRSVVHVQPLVAIRAGESVRRFVLTEAGYRALARHVEDSLQPGGAGEPIALPGVTHGTGDAFLRGRDRFWLLRSCNVWVGEALRKAGLPVGLWTPVAQSLMWSLGPGDAPGR